MAKKEDKYRKYKIWFWAIFAFPFVLLITIFILISLEVFGPMPGFAELENPDNSLAAEVYSADGVLLGKYFLQNRTWADYDEISPYVVDALIATEDIRFHRHSGIDVRGLMRVLIKSILLGQESGGGSTISQQLAKNLYSTREIMQDGTVRSHSIGLGLAKLKEWATAVRLERNYTKEEIIAMYLNQYDFLFNAVGISSASSVYFNTTPDSLKIEEAAIIVGMLKNPIQYNPRRNPENMMERRNIVLSQMGKYGYLEQEVADSLMQLPIEIDFREEDHNTGLATYLREYVRTTMIAYEPEENMFLLNSQYLDARKEWDNNALYGWCRKNKKPDGSNYNLYSDGLKIFTTIDSRMQKYAEEAVAEHLALDLQPAFSNIAKNFRNPPFSNDLKSAQIERIMDISIRRTDRYRNMSGRVSEDSIWIAFNTPVPMEIFRWEGDIDTVMTPYDSVLYYKYFVRSSMMAMDPHTGHVKAYVGGPDFRYFKYDAVNQQRKQVGSTIKPFLYTLAMQEGFSPCYEVENIPREFEDNDTIWSPRSSGPKEYHGRMVTLKWGLANSENYISAWLMKQFTPQAVVDLMARMGINRRYIDPVNSIFLGTSVLTLNEMVGAFGAYANKGVFTQPLVVSRIEDKNGNVISLFTPRIDEVMSEEEAFLMVSLLRGVVDEGTGIRLRWKYELGGQIGGKTGTTQNHSNGWFMGITPNLVGGVWTGWEDQSIHFEDMTHGQGANMALPVFALFMQKLFADPELGIMEADEFDQPPGFNIELDCDKVRRQGQARNIYDLEEF
ncbi:MAG: transglycosylase domain-containing protein [Bacteroidales bacterium]|nr:transglycosylase domain-containing protein [Bacteroidales bacterium]